MSSVLNRAAARIRCAGRNHARPAPTGPLATAHPVRVVASPPTVRVRRPVADAPGAGDRGTGLIGTTVAITVFLTFLLLAVQLLFSLWTRTSVTSAAYDGARVAAGARAGSEVGLDDGVRAQAEDRVRQQLGPAGRDARIDWTGSDGDTITLRVQVDAPRFLSSAIAGPLATDHIDRTVHVRVERDR